MRSRVAREFSIILLVTYLCVFMGGFPFSILLLKIHSKITGSEIYSYNINRNIDIGKRVNGIKEELKIKSDVGNISRFIEILDKKGINIVEIPTSKDEEIRKFRIDGEEDVLNYFFTLNKLNIKFPYLENRFLNSKEIVILIKEK